MLTHQGMGCCSHLSHGTGTNWQAQTGLRSDTSLQRWGSQVCRSWWGEGLLSLLDPHNLIISLHSHQQRWETSVLWNFLFLLGRQWLSSILGMWNFIHEVKTTAKLLVRGWMLRSRSIIILYLLVFVQFKCLGLPPISACDPPTWPVQENHSLL